MKDSGITSDNAVKPVREMTAMEKVRSVSAKINRIIDTIGKWLFHLRKFFLAAPVVYYALKIASYNREHLPEMVGLGLLSSGEFTLTIGRGLAVMGPVALTFGCLAMMFFSRKAMYAWAISVFSLTLPLLLLVSNIYPS